VVGQRHLLVVGRPRRLPRVARPVRLDLVDVVGTTVQSDRVAVDGVVAVGGAVAVVDPVDGRSSPGLRSPVVSLLFPCVCDRTVSTSNGSEQAPSNGIGQAPVIVIIVAIYRSDCTPSCGRSGTDLQ
jgi:hypothetical protein